MRVHFRNINLATDWGPPQTEEQLKQEPMDLASGLLALWSQASESTGLLGFMLAGTWCVQVFHIPGRGDEASTSQKLKNVWKREGLGRVRLGQRLPSSSTQVKTA